MIIIFFINFAFYSCIIRQLPHFILLTSNPTFSNVINDTLISFDLLFLDTPCTNHFIQLSLILCLKYVSYNQKIANFYFFTTVLFVAKYLFYFFLFTLYMFIMSNYFASFSSSPILLA